MVSAIDRSWTVATVVATFVPEPLRLGHLRQPGRGSLGERVERRAQRLGDHLQPAQFTRRRQHMRGVRPSSPRALEQPLLTGRDQDAVQHPAPHVRPGQPVTELRQHREVEAGSSSSSPSAYFQSIRARTASAACRSVSPSTNCNTDTSASPPGDQAGLPRTGNRSANSSSPNNGPSPSRTRIARLPFGNAARATRAVSAGISQIPSAASTSAPTPYDNVVGLQDHNQVSKADVTHGPE